MGYFFLIIGIAGVVVSILGNLPMILHLYKVKDSTGQSLMAWYVWEVANFMLLASAFYAKDPVFIGLQLAWVVFVAITIYLIIIYRRKVSDEVIL